MRVSASVVTISGRGNVHGADSAALLAHTVAGVYLFIGMIFFSVPICVYLIYNVNLGLYPGPAMTSQTVFRSLFPLPLSPASTRSFVSSVEFEVAAKSQRLVAATPSSLLAARVGTAARITSLSNASAITASS